MDKLALTKIELFHENSTFNIATKSLLPDDFYITSLSSNQEINNAFNRICSLLSIAFLSNTSEISNIDLFSCKILGYKKIFYDEVKIECFSKDIQLIYKIYSWAFENGNKPDKLGLVRNIFSLHTDNNGKIKFDNELWESINSNYQIYLKENIKNYLEIKNKIIEISIDSMSRTYQIADEIISSFKNNILIIFTFLLSVVVVNGFKDVGIDQIFSSTYVAITALITVLSTTWMVIIRNLSISRFDEAAKTLKKALLLNYSALIMENEIDECVTPIIKDNRKYLSSQIKKMCISWSLFLALFFISFIIANKTLHDSNESSPIDATYNPYSISICSNDSTAPFNLEMPKKVCFISDIP